MQYISAQLAPGRITDSLLSVRGKITKKALVLAVKEGVPLEFISLSSFHRPGAWFTIPEAVEVYGPVGIEVRSGTAMVAMIEADGSKVVVR